MLQLPPAHHKTNKHDSPNETKIKEKQNKTTPDLNSKLTKSMTHRNQTKKLATWFLTSVCQLHHKTDGGRSTQDTRRDLEACFTWKQVWLGFSSLVRRLAEA
jgi:hypothetical protein